MIARGKNSNSLVNQAFIMAILSHLIVSAFKSIKIKNPFYIKTNTYFNWLFIKMLRIFVQKVNHQFQFYIIFIFYLDILYILIVNLKIQTLNELDINFRVKSTKR